MARKSLETHRHIQEFLDILVHFIHFLQFRIHLQTFLNRDAKFHRHRFCNRIHQRIRKIQHASDIADNHARCHRTKCNDLHHFFFSIFFRYVINDFLPAFDAKVNIDIGHRDTLFIQKSLKDQIILDRIDNIRDLKCVRHDTSGCRTSPRANRNAVVFGIFDKIPYNQEIIDKSHTGNRIQFIIQAVLKHLFIVLTVVVFALQSFLAQFPQVTLRRIAFRHLKMRQFVMSKFNRHMAAFCDLMCIGDGFRRIREQFCHFFRRFQIILSAVIPHTVFVCHFFPGLNAQKDIVRFLVGVINIMKVIGRHEVNARLIVHTQKPLIDDLLWLQSMIL